jgi:hypothetical protein
MLRMPPKFEPIDLGRILVVLEDSKLTKQDVKRLTKSKKVTELKPNRKSNLNAETTAIWYICKCMEVINKISDLAMVRIFKVDEHAVSTMVSLADSSFIAAMDLTWDDLLKLEACVKAILEIDEVWYGLCHISKECFEIKKTAASASVDMGLLAADIDRLDILKERFGCHTHNQAVENLKLLTSRKW